MTEEDEEAGSDDNNVKEVLFPPKIHKQQETELVELQQKIYPLNSSPKIKRKTNVTSLPGDTSPFHCDLDLAGDYDSLVSSEEENEHLRKENEHLRKELEYIRQRLADVQNNNGQQKQSANNGTFTAIAQNEDRPPPSPWNQFFGLRVPDIGTGSDNNKEHADDTTAKADKFEYSENTCSENSTGTGLHHRRSIKPLQNTLNPAGTEIETVTKVEPSCIYEEGSVGSDRSRKSLLALELGDVAGTQQSPILHHRRALRHSNIIVDDDSEMSFCASVKDRASWLVGLLVLQSLSSFIISRNEDLLQEHLVIVQFLTMLVGAGGNAGNQASVRGKQKKVLRIRKLWRPFFAFFSAAN